ncbi:MAG TPA: DNA recombination protein RmuC [Candidatus Cloacimonas sp.]|jgi:DNA recombination protein RmuC|nr:recombination protein RmuC [Candidatus Cloacimonadota bacterium]HCX73558.1 DNA recombination protein RmuC [Candidatus Cloacimonas sp.]
MLDIIIIAVAILLAAVIVGIFLNRKPQNDQQIQKLREEVQLLHSENTKLKTQKEYLEQQQQKLTQQLTEKSDKVLELSNVNSQIKTENKNLQQKMAEHEAELEDLQAKFKDSFQNLANEILEDKSKRFTEKNQQNLRELLTPLHERIKEFETKVENTHKENLKSNISLTEQLKQLQQLNQQISDDANNLTKALKGEVKVQGNWGEVILERILEESGLRKGVEYETQPSYTDENRKRLQPDVVIKLPEDKHIIIDSKVSLLAYEQLVAAENEAKQQAHLKKLLTSVKNHIKELEKKHYSNIQQINSPDFVLMFMPIEGSFALVMQQDSDLYRFALAKQIVIVSPTTLLATLRTISYIWRQENQTKNAMEIARQSGLLYDKFVGFLDDMEKIDTNIKRARNAYDAAINKLSTGRGNLVTRVEKLRDMGAQSSKKIPENFANEE